MTVRHKVVYSKHQLFRTPSTKGIAVIERCSRAHDSERAGADCPIVRVTTYTEGQERQVRQLSVADLAEWLKLR